MKALLVCDCGTEYSTDGTDEGGEAQRQSANDHLTANPTHCVLTKFQAE